MFKQMSNEEYLARVAAFEATLSKAADPTIEMTIEPEPFGWKLDALKAERGYGEAIGSGLRSGADFVVDTACDSASFVTDTVVDTASAVGGFASGFWKGLTGK